MIMIAKKGAWGKRTNLLDVVEDVEKRRRKLLIAVTDNFVSWERIFTRTRELVEEYKRRKFEQQQG